MIGLSIELSINRTVHWTTYEGYSATIYGSEEQGFPINVKRNRKRITTTV